MRHLLSSWRKLTAKRMYHGTSFEFKPGDILEGGKGEAQWDYGDIGMNVVWMHDNPETARLYGDHVYEVEPLDWLDNYSEEAGHDDLAPGRQEWISPKVRVVRRVS